MSIFVIVAGLMLAVALAWVLVPLFRRAGGGSGIEREASNLAILRDQLAELEDDLRSGTLSEDRYREARMDLERRVLEDSRAAEGAAARTPGANRGVAVALGVSLPIAAVALYLVLGSPEAFSPENAAGTPQHAVTREQLEGMLVKLAARLEKAPEDAEGWAMLARSYNVLGRFPEAASAYERLAKLVPGDADVLANYADALAMVQGKNLEGKPMELIERALAIDPRHWKALALAGTAAFERKDFRRAISYWERAQKSLAPDSPVLQSLASSIAEARELGGIKAPRKAAAASGLDAKAGVSGRISVSPALSAKFSPDDTLFIFARAAEGRTAPVAILRKRAGDLPLAFTLDDSATMMPGASLAAFDQLVIGARISKSGSAMPQAGDMEGFAPPVRPGARNVAVVINTVRAQ